MTNLEVVKEVCGWLGKDFEKSYKHTPNRHGQDNEYSINSSKIREALDWTPKYDNELYNFINNKI